jgi:outer membrane protein assembly factor BamB
VRNAHRGIGVAISFVAFASISSVCGQDWPQWRGPNRDAKATAFEAPKAWPKELTQKWKVAVGEGVSTPALVGDKLYVFARQGGNEITRCLDATTGKELWQDKYESQGATGPSAYFSGPRSSPTVVDGKVIVLGVRGTLSCLDAATGKVLWRKDDFKGTAPQFFTSCSPVVVDGLCIAQLGGEMKGAIVAYDLAAGNEKWQWTGDGTAYASPVIDTVDGARMIVAETAAKIVGINASDGKLLWETPFPKQGRSYNACTPIANGGTVIFSGGGRGTKAIKLEKQGDAFAVKELWNNADSAVQFNTPVVKNGSVFGLSATDVLFCLNAETGKAAWTKPFPKPMGDAPSAGGGGGGGGGGGMMRGRTGYGSIVDAGSVLVALIPAAQMVVFEPGDKEFKQVATYMVGDSDTYAYPLLSGKRIFIKDKESLILWMVE